MYGREGLNVRNWDHNFTKIVLDELNSNQDKLFHKFHIFLSNLYVIYK